MTSDPKEALERLKALGALGFEDAAVIIADLDKREAEVERLREANGNLQRWLKYSDDFRRADRAKLSALETMLGKFVRADGSTMLTVEGVNFGTALRQALAALLDHPAPVEK